MSWLTVFCLTDVASYVSYRWPWSCRLDDVLGREFCAAVVAFIIIAKLQSGNQPRSRFGCRVDSDVPETVGERTGPA